MKKICLLLLFSALCVGLRAQSAQVVETFKLGVRDSIILNVESYSLYKDQYKDKQNALENKYVDIIFNSDTLHDFFTPDNLHAVGIYDLKTFFREVEWDIKRNIGHSDYYSFSLNSVLPPTVAQNSLVLARKMIRVKSVRECLFGIVANLFVEICELYPKDYQASLIAGLEEMQTFLDDIPNHKYKIVTDTEGYEVFNVDGKLNEDFGMSAEGFVLRRMYKDDVPIQEIKGYVSQMLSRLKKVENQNNPDVFYKATINKNLSFYLCSNGWYFETKKGQRAGTGYIYNDPCVALIRTKDTEYYRILNGISRWDWNSGDVWTPCLKDCSPFAELRINADGDIIYKKD